jgi:hypothetical protein
MIEEELNDKMMIPINWASCVQDQTTSVYLKRTSRCFLRLILTPTDVRSASISEASGEHDHA